MTKLLDTITKAQELASECGHPNLAADLLEAYTKIAGLQTLAEAFVSYLEDDSRSPRRRAHCLHVARSLVAATVGTPYN